MKYNQQQYRIIQDEDELTIITADGGVVCLYRKDPSDDFPFVAESDYYAMSISEVNLDNLSEDNNIWNELAEDKIYSARWNWSDFDSKEVIEDALRWLGTDPRLALQNNTLFLRVFPPTTDINFGEMHMTNIEISDIVYLDMPLSSLYIQEYDDSGLTVGKLGRLITWSKSVNVTDPSSTIDSIRSGISKVLNTGGSVKLMYGDNDYTDIVLKELNITLK